MQGLLLDKCVNAEAKRTRKNAKVREHTHHLAWSAVLRTTTLPFILPVPCCGPLTARKHTNKGKSGGGSTAELLPDAGCVERMQKALHNRR